MLIQQAMKRRRQQIILIDDFEDHFSLKKLAKDVGKMATAPIKIAVNSVKGKKTEINYETGFGKLVGGAVDKGNTALNKTVKSFADTVTGGYATKAANLVRSDKNKEKAYSYNDGTSKTGIKLIDKGSATLDKVGTVAGATFAGYGAAKNVIGAAQKGTNAALTPEQQLYEKGIVPNDGKASTGQYVDEIINEKPDKGLLNDMIAGNETPIEQEMLAKNKQAVQDTQNQNATSEGKIKMAGFFGGDTMIYVIIGVVILLLLTSK